MCIPLSSGAIVVFSSTEAVYVTITEACKEMIWFKVLLNETGFEQEDCTWFNDS